MGFRGPRRLCARHDGHAFPRSGEPSFWRSARRSARSSAAGVRHTLGLAGSSRAIVAFYEAARPTVTSLGDREKTDGTFNDERRRLYEIALDVQKTVISRIRPGVTWRELHRVRGGSTRSLRVDRPSA